MTSPSHDRCGARGPGDGGSAWGRLARMVPVWSLVVLLAAGCEEDVTAVVGTELPFTLYGVLTPQADTQWVRVYPIEGRLEPAAPAPLDARFVSTDRTSGEQQVWSDSLIREANGMFAHVFWSPFPAAFERTYVLEVERSDGAVTGVATTVPPITELVLPDQQNVAPAVFPVSIVGEAPNLIRIEVTYTFKYVNRSGEARDRATVTYDGHQRRVPGGWLIQVLVAQDLRDIQRQLQDRVFVDPNIGLKLVELRIRLIVANAEWIPPGGSFDPEVLVQPGTMSNVTNGFGFVGAGYRLQDTWVPLDTVITAGS